MDYAQMATDRLRAHVAGTAKPIIRPDSIFPVEDATYTQTTGTTHALIRDGKLLVERQYCQFIPTDDVTIDGMTYTADEILAAMEGRT